MVCHDQAEAREAGRKLLDSERQLAETRAEEHATRARLDADMAAPKTRPSSGRSRLRCAHDTPLNLSPIDAIPPRAERIETLNFRVLLEMKGGACSHSKKLTSCTLQRPHALFQWNTCGPMDMLMV